MSDTLNVAKMALGAAQMLCHLSAQPDFTDDLLRCGWELWLEACCKAFCATRRLTKAELFRAIEAIMEHLGQHADLDDLRKFRERMNRLYDGLFGEEGS
jgi:hypothetical protein